MDEVRCYKQNQSSSVIKSQKVLLFSVKQHSKVALVIQKQIVYLWAITARASLSGSVSLINKFSFFFI